MNTGAAHYYTPAPSPWPIIGSIGLFLLVIGIARILHAEPAAWTLFLLGSGILVFMMAGWFGTVIRESESGCYNEQVDISYRWGMAWFIFSEVMFFAAFFGALFYARNFAVPWLGGAGNNALTHALLWPDFVAHWPLLHLPGDGFEPAHGAIGAWGLPALNTAILVSSGVTLTWAHWGLKRGHRRQLIAGLAVTIGLGFLFLVLQAVEFSHAVESLNLKLNSGIFGTTFYMLTGFHGAHVCIGAIMLCVMLGRAIRGHFAPDRHFAFEATSWYWHFVDVVWLCLFVLVYWL